MNAQEITTLVKRLQHIKDCSMCEEIKMALSTYMAASSATVAALSLVASSATLLGYQVHRS